MKHVFADLAKKAGCLAVIEPPTEDITLGALTPALCRLLCPDKHTSHTSQLSTQIADLLQKRCRAVACNDLTEATRISADLLRLAREFDTTASGRRLDLQITGNGCEAWLDVSGVWPSAGSNIALSQNFALSLAQIKLNQPDAKIRESSQPLINRAMRKREVYLPLLDVAKRQVTTKDRSFAPTFFPAIFSGFGEFSSEMFLLIEWLVKEYRTNLISGSLHAPGLSISHASGIFRSHCKELIASTIAIGMGTLFERVGFIVPSRSQQHNARISSSSPLSSPSSSSLLYLSHHHHLHLYHPHLPRHFPFLRPRSFHFPFYVHHFLHFLLRHSRLIIRLPFLLRIQIIIHLIDRRVNSLLETFPILSLYYRYLHPLPLLPLPRPLVRQLLYLLAPLINWTMIVLVS